MGVPSPCFPDPLPSSPHEPLYRLKTTSPSPCSQNLAFPELVLWSHGPLTALCQPLQWQPTAY